MTNDFKIDITKRTRLNRWRNEMWSGEEWLINGRIYNADKTKYRPFKLVIMFEYWEISEHYESDNIKLTNENIKQYIDERITDYTMNINGYNDVDYFYELCNNSIEQYNNRYKKTA